MGYLDSLIGWNCFISLPFGACTHFSLALSKARKDSRHRLEDGKGFRNAINKEIAHFAPKGRADV